MFVITNRDLEPNKTGLKQFGDRVNPKGPNELRMVEIVGRGQRRRVNIVPDELDDRWETQAGIDSAWRKSMGLTARSKLYGSHYVAAKLLQRVSPRRVGIRGRKGRNLVVFVHGYNNNMKDIVERAEAFERNYGVEVLAFSWPANGGGLKGLASYKSDKRDAKASVGALDRTLLKMQNLLTQFHSSWAEQIRELVDREEKKRPGGSSAETHASRMATLAAEESKGCPFTVNLVLHSMGNYLFKHLLKSTASEGNGLVFDNVCLVAADTNNKDHAFWVDRIRVRNRVYVAINEDDKALAVSRMKSGDDQLARLGHYPYRLDSRLAVYVSFTDEKAVSKNSHAYFEGSTIRDNTKVKRFFKEALNGKRAEDRLTYEPSSNMHLF